MTPDEVAWYQERLRELAEQRKQAMNPPRI